MALDAAQEVLKEDGPDPHRVRVTIDAFKWQAGKLAPSVYGEKQTVTHKFDGDITKLSLEEFENLERSLLASRPGGDSRGREDDRGVRRKWLKTDQASEWVPRPFDEIEGSSTA